MKRVLVVVDMQPRFSTSQKQETITGCIREVKKAIEDKDGIVFLEYEGMGQTDDRLISATGDYPNVAYLTKENDDGSEEVKNYLVRYGWRFGSFTVCGVNTDACVKDTVLGLAEIFPQKTITVVKDACNGNYPCNPESNIKAKNVAFV